MVDPFPDENEKKREPAGKAPKTEDKEDGDDEDIAAHIADSEPDAHQQQPMEPTHQESAQSTIPQTPDDLVYPAARMCHEDSSPLTLYLPTKHMLFKLMRACISVGKAEELWFN